MMEQVGVGLADLGADRLERHRVRPLLDQQPARGFQRLRAALFRGKTRTHY